MKILEDGGTKLHECSPCYLVELPVHQTTKVVSAIHVWCTETFGTNKINKTWSETTLSYYFGFIRGKTDYYSFYFRHKDDAMLFELTWG
jgi:hypothetical protein